MLTVDRQILSFRTLAILPIVFFTPPVVSFAVAPGAVWAEYPGILFHLAMLFLIARMDAPEWARAAGYGWITIDVLTAVLVINEMPEDLTWAIRLGGHVLAGVWIVTAALLARWLPIRVTGTVAGGFLGLYSLGSAVLPEQALYPASPFMVLWLVLLAARYKPTPRTTPAPPTPPAPDCRARHRLSRPGRRALSRRPGRSGDRPGFASFSATTSAVAG